MTGNEQENEVKLKNGNVEELENEIENISMITKIERQQRSDPITLQRKLSKESMKLKEKQDTELWLTENGLSELIACFNKEELTKEHLRDISNDMVTALCDEFKWSIVVQLKLKKQFKI